MQLLNDPSFVAWLEGNGLIHDNEKWEKWLNDDQNREVTVNKAKKIITMPFSNELIDVTDIKNELNKIESNSDKQHPARSGIRNRLLKIHKP